MACAALMLLLGASPRAQADAEKVRLVYEREPGTERCPAEPYLHQEVTRRLGHDPFTNEDASKTVTVTMTRRGGYYQGAAQLTDADGRRLWEQDPPLYDPDCELVVSSVALSLVVALTPLQASPEPSEAPPAPPPAPPAPASAPAPRSAPPTPPPTVLPSEVPPRPAPASSRAPRVQFGAGAFGAFLRTPAPGLGVFISAGLRWPHLSIMFDGRAQLPLVSSELQSAAGSVTDVRATLATGSLAPCIHPGAMFLCTPLELGVRSVTAAGSNIAKANSPFVSVGLRTGIEWPLNQGLLLRGYTDIGATLLAGDVTIEREVAWTFPPVSIVLSAALIASFDVGPSTTRLSTTRQTAYRLWP